jgi:hypothetical protein
VPATGFGYLVSTQSQNCAIPGAIRRGVTSPARSDEAGPAGGFVCDSWAFIAYFDDAYAVGSIL